MSADICAFMCVRGKRRLCVWQTASSVMSLAEEERNTLQLLMHIQLRLLI